MSKRRGLKEIFRSDLSAANSHYRRAWGFATGGLMHEAAKHYRLFQDALARTINTNSEQGFRNYYLATSAAGIDYNHSVELFRRLERGQSDQAKDAEEQRRAGSAPAAAA